MAENGPVRHPVDIDALLRPRPPSPLHEVHDERFARRGVRLLLKRDDLIHSTLLWDPEALGQVDLHPAGNKWRKLAPNLRIAAERGHHTLVTFGGAYSNHLRATAAAGRLLGFETVGIVRGQELAERPLNPSLTRCAAHGMRLHFTDRHRYRHKADPRVLEELLTEAGAPGGFVIPEGGSNPAAVRGCEELGAELRGRADLVGVACGTGGTLAGLAAGLDAHQQALGIPVLKGGFLDAEVTALQCKTFGSRRGEWSLDDRFHFGGYGRVPTELDSFAAEFGERHGITIERIYVAKLLYGLTTMAREGALAPGSTVAAVITGSP
ncbi:1-aminocyclopropane-1-carboxylate deaminase/D-cysteine desulfhydrase [Streptomyces sp. NPDC006879]|uniref:1-aminocyclopropane-1-carboxylate deaminase/D-cysteine desulfhydrase n=1 Tax=Streptomyces sp. NPDC006879 TaxID=3364767 RepID=UPI00368AA876